MMRDDGSDYRGRRRRPACMGGQGGVDCRVAADWGQGTGQSAERRHTVRGELLQVGGRGRVAGGSGASHV